jgi:hypothetical protein
MMMSDPEVCALSNAETASTAPFGNEPCTDVGSIDSGIAGCHLRKQPRSRAVGGDW